MATALYRERLIPKERILLKDDNIVYQDPTCIITTWSTLHPKQEFDHGISLYLLEEGFKISYFFEASGALHYIYCDIIEVNYDPATDTYVFVDLLADVIIENDGRVRVLDLDELAQANEEGIITTAQLNKSLYRLDKLLAKAYNNDLGQYTRLLDPYRF